jgi:Derlin-2/3
MILMSLLSPGGVFTVPLQIMGILVAHMYDFLTRLWPELGGGRNLLPTPGWVSYLVQTPRILRRGYGTVLRPTDQPVGGSEGRSTGVSMGSGPLPDAWRTRGQGRRLGGE